MNNFVNDHMCVMKKDFRSHARWDGTDEGAIGVARVLREIFPGKSIDVVCSRPATAPSLPSGLQVLIDGHYAAALTPTKNNWIFDPESFGRCDTYLSDKQFALYVRRVSIKGEPVEDLLSGDVF